MNTREKVIEVQGLTKSFGNRTVVNSVDLEVEEGRIFGFLGPNGSGKTTFIRMLCGLLKPDGGRGTCLGYDIYKQSRQIKLRSGYMSQKFGLYQDLTVRENLMFMAQVHGLDKRAKRVDQAIGRMGLENYTNHLAGALSGGWKQRLALTACTLHQPSLLLLDEPTAGVDPAARRDFWDQVHNLAQEGITALISTHYMDEAERCHQLAYIAYGEILAKGDRQALIDNAGLTTYAVDGDSLFELSQKLKLEPGLDQVVFFGNRLHVSSRRPEIMAKLAQSDRENTWRQVETSLEEVFIHLMQRKKD